VRGTTPPSPSTGSSRIADVRSETAARKAGASFGGTNRAPGRSGTNGARYAACPVTESAPNVRPWKPSSSATTSERPGFLSRANFSAASFASVPLLQKKTRERPEAFVRRSASIPCAGWK
jgi:hypothetical protein